MSYTVYMQIFKYLPVQCLFQFRLVIQNIHAPKNMQNLEFRFKICAYSIQYVRIKVAQHHTYLLVNVQAMCVRYWVKTVCKFSLSLFFFFYEKIRDRKSRDTGALISIFFGHI